jgi:hypothetical protein
MNRVTRTGEDGTFQIWLPPGGRDVIVWRRGVIPGIVKDVQVTVGGTTDVGTIRLEAGLAVEGTVVDTKDRPVESVVVVAYRDESMLAAQLLPARAGLAAWGGRALTNERGEFRIGGLGPEPVKVKVEEVSVAMVGDPPEAVPGKPGPRIVVKRLRIATGKVVTEAEGVGVGGAKVQLEVIWPGKRLAMPRTTVESGRFAMDLSEDRFASEDIRFDITVSAEGYEDVKLTDLTIEDLLPEAKLRIPLVRAPPGDPGTLRGRVLLDVGRPYVGGITMSLTQEGKAGQVFTVETNESGEFVLEGVPSGQYVLHSAPRGDLVLRDTGQTFYVPPGASPRWSRTARRGGRRTRRSRGG